MVAEAAQFMPAGMLYRRAVAMTKQAEQRAIQHQKSASRERRLREIDSVVETIVLSQAAAEAWIHAAYRLANVEPRPRTGWQTRWKDAPKSICGTTTRDLDKNTTDSLYWLNAWRNYLVHNDAQARQRLAEIVTPGTEAEHLTAATATAVIERMDAAFTDVGAIIGARTLPGLHSTVLWVAFDEV